MWLLLVLLAILVLAAAQYMMQEQVVDPVLNEWLNTMDTGLMWVITGGLAIAFLFLNPWLVVQYVVLLWFGIRNLLFYFFYDVVRWPYHYADAGVKFKTEVLGNQVTWAWWMPAGILNRHYWNHEPVPSGTLMVQAAIGIVLVVLIQGFQ